MTELNKHVVSLELSRRLKELKVPQNSHFVWFNNSGITGDAFWTLGYKEEIIDNGVTLYPEKTISAYLASELGEFIGNSLENGEDKDLPEELQPTTYQDIWKPDYLAKLLIWLLENHLISVEELGK